MVISVSSGCSFIKSCAVLGIPVICKVVLSPKQIAGLLDDISGLLINTVVSVRKSLPHPKESIASA